MITKREAKRDCILWGKHSAHGGVWLKLSAYTVKAYRERQKEGFELRIMYKGLSPE